MRIVIFPAPLWVARDGARVLPPVQHLTSLRCELRWKSSLAERISVFIRPRAHHGDTVHSLLHETSTFRLADAPPAFCRLVLVPGPVLNWGGVEAGVRRS